jgi:hypothetical protein
MFHDYLYVYSIVISLSLILMECMFTMINVHYPFPTNFFSITEHFAIDFSTFNFLFNQITFTKHSCLENSKDLGKKREVIKNISILKRNMSRTMTIAIFDEQIRL